MDSIYVLLLLVLMPLSLYAQNRVQKVFGKYNGLPASCGLSAAQVAAMLLADGGSDVRLTTVEGTLTDHYDPASGTVALSTQVASSGGVAAIAVAAHEVGHVMQYQEGYMPIRLRNAILPAAKLGSGAAPWIVILGLLMGSYHLAIAGVILFGAVLLFQVVTLPVEFDASRRALEMLEGGGYVTYEESDGAKAVLRAAATTYVYAALAGLLSFLRYYTLAQGSRRRR